MFSIRLITADSYQATPLPLLDPTYSEFRGAEIKNVPIVRVFGTTPTGEKTCLHLHGAFPYVYVPFSGEYNADIFPYKLAISLDAAINVSLGSAMSNTQHVYQIERVAGIPFYGYHKQEHQFLKVYFYNPAMMKRATDLLQNGSVLNTRLQPHEAHVPYILQFMIDYNLHGMSFINLLNVKYRCVSQLLPTTKQSDDSIMSLEKIVDHLPDSVARQSVCQFEVDALVTDIQNRQELLKGIELNPGLATIWKEERARRVQAGLSSDDSQLVNPISPKRSAYHDTESDIHQQQRLNRRLQLISQCNESTISTNTVSTPYPLEIDDGNHLINASNLEGYSRNNPKKSQKNLSDVNNLTLPHVSQISEGLPTQHDSSLLDVEDVQLVEILMELARDSGDHASIDDDSVLGTQSSMLDKAVDNDGIEDEDDVVDLNITCSELDEISFCDDIEKSSSRLIPMNILEVETKVLQTSRGDIISQDTNYNSRGSTEMLLPQLDGVGDESNLLGSDHDEAVTGYEELERVSECQISISTQNSWMNGDDDKFVAEELIPDWTQSDRLDVPTMSRIDNACLTCVPYRRNSEKFGTINYDSGPYGAKVGKDNRSIVLKLSSENDPKIIDLDGNTLEIVALSIRKRNENSLQNIYEHCTHPGCLTARQGEKNEDLMLTPLIMKINLLQSLPRDINMMNQDDTKIIDIRPTLNRRSAIISSSHSELSMFVKHPKIWCFTDRRILDFTFITSENNTGNKTNSEFPHSLIDDEDQAVVENNEMKSSVDEYGVPAVIRISVDDGAVESMIIDRPEFMKNETTMTIKNTITDCHQLLNDGTSTINDLGVDVNENKDDDDNAIQIAGVTSEKGHENKIVKMNSYVDYKSVVNEHVKYIAKKSEPDSVLECESRATNNILKKNEKLCIEKTEFSCESKFDRESKLIRIKWAIVLDSCNKSWNGNIVGYVDEKQVSAPDCIEIKNDPLISRNTNELLIVYESNAEAIPYANITSVRCTNKFKSFQIKSQCDREKSNMPTSNTQSSIKNPKKCISLVANQFGCCQDSGRLLRSLKTTTGHRNDLDTVSINQIVVIIKSTITDQQLWLKSPKQKCFGIISLCLLKPRRLGWSSDHITAGSIELQQPYVALRSLASSVSKYYSYTWLLKTKIFSNRFGTIANEYTIPAFDGPADVSSSDSESDADPIEINLEKRVCMYRSLRKKIVREAVITPKKRKPSHSDEDVEIDKGKCAKRCTKQQTSDTLKRPSCLMHRCICRSPSISESYSPLKITITSSTICNGIHNYSDKLRFGNPSLVASTKSECTTPNRRKQSMHEGSLRSEIVQPATDERGNVCSLAKNIQLRFMDTRVNNPEIQSPVVLPRRPCQNQDISPNVRNAINIRKILFLSTTDSSPAGLLSSHRDARINRREDSIKSTTALYESRIVKPYINSEVGDNSDNVSTMLRQSIEDICPNNSISKHIDELHTDEDKLYEVTFTQYLRSYEPKELSLSCSIRSEILSESGQASSIVPKFNPPPIKRVIDTLKIYDIQEFENSQPYFSNHADAPRQKEIVHRMLNVPGKSVISRPIFKSIIENITGLNCWRRMKINEFYLGHRIHFSDGKSESKGLRQSLAGKAPVVIVPLLSPPIPKNVMGWLRLRNYSGTLQENRAAVTTSRNQMKKNEENMNLVETKLKNDCLNVLDSNVKSGSLEQTIVSSWTKLGRTPNVLRKDAADFQARLMTHDIAGESNMMSRNGEGAPSLENILAKSTLFKTMAQSEKFGISCGQIDCLPHTIRSDVVNENMQNCRALTRYQFITIFCAEVHVNTRDDLLPNPQYDPISALFYAIQNDAPPTSSIKPLKHGVILMSTEGENKSDYCYGSKIPFVITFVADEKELFDTFMDIVNCSDAEILIGWEMEFLSWGYIVQRALRLGINLIKGISRVPTSQWRWDNQTSDKFNSVGDMKLPGRIVLDIWRIMKSEIALLTYTFENVMYHVMNERLPCPSFKSLTTWWHAIPSRWRVVQHYSRMVLGILRMLEQLDIIGRTSEFARLFGIQFYEVFSRGSQYRVESLMLRLAKPLNYVAVSPSPQQRSSMRAMEALPLIMEPESMFYSDPVVVLDFQSLYPSIIIAHNYCYSTCLGRVEHIGQPNPFEFGASVLRIPKHTALKLRGKVNYAPCGVAFVKQEVRFGILPRMLTEILNTRLMVKKAMKDHSQDDKLLQRVLHSRQKGLKDLANVTYGYTAANFTGRMPCIEVGDSVVSKAKETLERAIRLVESMPQWGARVIYGDTDSLFIVIPGKSKSDAFKIGYEIADAVTASNISPIKLKFEKILYPAILQSKKRYCGYMYETLDQNKPKFLAKGIETVRRDGCPAVSKILEKSLRILFDSKDVSLLKQYVTRQLDKVLSGKVSVEDLTFAKEFRGINGYKERACVPALELTRRLLRKDPRALPRRGERVRYVIVAGAPNQPLIHCVRSPWELINDSGLRLNGIYYVTRVIIPPLSRCLSLMGVDINMWYKEMTHRQMIHNPVATPKHKQKQTISQYFGAVTCASCGRTSNRGICNDCLNNPTETLIVLHERLRWLERINDHITTICQSCVGRGHIVDCVSLDCPVLYRRCQAHRDLTQGTTLQRMIQAGNVFSF